MPVKTKAEMNAEELQRASTYLKKAPPVGKFGPNNLRWPTDWLGRLGPTVVFLPLEEMALYCDGVIDSLLEKNEVITLERLLQDVSETRINYGALNATAIGNLAAIALRGTEGTHREKARRVLDKIHSWRMEMLHCKFN